MYLARSGSPGQQARLGVVARLGSDVDRHPRDPTEARHLGQDQVHDARRRADPRADPPLLRRGPGRARLPRGRRAARPRPLRRRRARTAGSSRSATPARTSSLPGAAAASTPTSTVRARARMLIGEQGAVSELWDAVSRRLPRPREDRPGQPVYTISTPPEPGESGLRPAEPGRSRPARARLRAWRTRSSSGSTRSERDSDGFRWRTRAQIEEGRSWLWAEDGVILFKAEASAWTPEAVQLQQVWTDPAARGQGNASRGLRDLIRLLLERVPRVCLFVRADNRRRDRALREGRNGARARLPQRAPVRELVARPPRRSRSSTCSSG